MVFQFAQGSPWNLFFAAFALLAFLGALSSLLFARRSPKWAACAALSLLTLACASALGAFVIGNQQVAEDNARFSQQLMDEYHVTSSRDLSSIRNSFYHFDEARTVFTQDGKETPVFIKLIHKDDEKIDMAFTVIDEKDLFPKPSQ